jgi:D-alanyl-D-alanine carboxypeptidase
MVRLLDQTFAQISANPTLVARASVPWQQVAQNAPAPAIAGFSLPQVAANPFAATSPVPSTMQSDDEDAAESMRAPDENFSLIHGEGAHRAAAPAGLSVNALAGATNSAPVSAMAQPAVPQSALSPAVAKADAPAVQNPRAVKTAVNAPVNAPRPQVRPSLREDAGEGDLEPAAPGRNWTIQIGAYADKTLALAQLKTYAGKAQDVLARASKIIAPIQSSHGHMIYRARFGLFAEQEARDVCSRLTQRGQSCFPAVQTR